MGERGVSGQPVPPSSHIPLKSFEVHAVVVAMTERARKMFGPDTLEACDNYMRQRLLKLKSNPKVVVTGEREATEGGVRALVEFHVLAADWPETIMRVAQVVNVTIPRPA